ncbi:MAG: hypothetical protein SF182_09030 [Deltaproteobacteria bacterium]|nr:hypothetical protein [Deltaproteobacteria bacterium]
MPQAKGDHTKSDANAVRGSVWLLAAALALIGLALLLLARPLLQLRRGAASDAQAAAAAPASRPLAAVTRIPGARPVRRSLPDPPTPPQDAGARDRAPTDASAAQASAAADAAANAAAEAEAPSGIQLFPAPGTKPLKPGIIVPPDFELPPGYVRHFQTTDDGEQLAPILMFHPDFDWVDGAGRPLTLPEDRIVPPELAPPGLTIRMLEVPDTHVPTLEDPPPGAVFEPDTR